jgi:hypothetical protein
MRKLFLGYVVCIVNILCTFSICNAQSWNSLGSGVDGSVYCMAVFKGELYVGGAFNNVDENNCVGIAKWNDTTWSPLGSGIGGLRPFVYCFYEFNDELYVGGSFKVAGGINVNYIAKWDGSDWSNAGDGINGDVFTLMSISNELYAGGNFGTRKWNGITWSTTSFLGADVYTFIEYAGKLHAGGSFVEPQSRVARLNLNGWGPVGSGISGAPVQTFALYKNGLYAAGNFTLTGNGYDAKHIAQYWGDDWSPVAGGVNGNVYSLLSYNNYLYAVGLFNAVGLPPSIYANNIAMFDGTNWTGFSNGTNDTIRSIISYNDNLYIGGMFDSAGNMRVNHIAKWVLPVGVKDNKFDTKQQYKILQNYPNPFNPVTNISFTLSKETFTTLKIYNILGREVETILNEKLEAGEHHIKWNAINYSSGLYYYRLISGDFIETKKMILLK